MAAAPSENIRRVVAELGQGKLVRDYLRDFRELAGVTVDFRSSEKWPPCNSGDTPAATALMQSVT